MSLDIDTDIHEIHQQLNLINQYLNQTNTQLKNEDTTINFQISSQCTSNHQILIQQFSTPFQFDVDADQLYFMNQKNITLEFEEYIQSEMKKQQYLIQQKKRRQIEKTRRIVYVQKHRSPVTTFNYHGIDIQVRYQRFQSFYGSCLVIPYQKLNMQGIIKLTNNRKLASGIMQRFDQHTIATSQQNQELLTLYCKKYFTNQNYNYLYLIKKPYYKYIRQYSAKKLTDNIKAIIQRSCYYRNTQSIVFSDFQWIGLNSNQKCQVFFWSLIQSIKGFIQKRKSNIHRVTVCCENQTSFFQFTNKLREISDIYVKSGLIQLN